MKPVTLSRDAADEVTDISRWYDDRRPGLGAELLDEIEAFLPHVGERPAAFPMLHATPGLRIRRALFPRFPYAPIFIDAGAEVRVIAVAHVRREPEYWLERIR